MSDLIHHNDEIKTIRLKYGLDSMFQRVLINDSDQSLINNDHNVINSHNSSDLSINNQSIINNNTISLNDSNSQLSNQSNIKDNQSASNVIAKVAKKRGRPKTK